MSSGNHSDNTAGFSVCPFSVGVFFATALAVTLQQRRQQQKQRETKKDVELLPSCQVVFVLGAPGVGKGTQCELLTKRLGGGNEWAHLSAGDLLRAERKKGGELGDLINQKIASGQLVPSEVTCKLLENGMNDVHRSKGITKFLIDGFPRSEGNNTAWIKKMSHHTVEFVLDFECPEEVLVGRLLERGQTSGRSDDTIDVIRKRFHTFQQETAPIVKEYSKQGKVKTIASDKPVEDVYAEVFKLFENL